MNPDYIKIYKYIVSLYRKTEHFHYATFDETYYSLRVFEMCKEIAQKIRKKVNMPSLLTAALLHDVGKIKIDKKLKFSGNDINSEDHLLWKTHPKLSVPIAKKYLEKEGFENKFIEEVCYLIENHSNNKITNKSIELQILQDADLIADTGMAGFIRPFMFAGKFKRPTIGTLNYIEKLEDRTEKKGRLNLKVSIKIAKKSMKLQRKLFNKMIQEVPSEFREIFSLENLKK